MKNKGFTLVELLAVIIILAIIAAIVLPMVTNSIDKAKNSASEHTIELYMEAIEETILSKKLEEDFKIEDGCYDIDINGNICIDSQCEEKVVVSAKNKPKGGLVCIENRSVTSIKYNDVTYTYDENKSLTNGYIISFNTYGGTPITNQIIGSGSKVAIPNAPQKHEYKFKEWLLDGEPYNFDTPVKSDMTLTATYEPTQVYMLNHSNTVNENIKSLVSGETVEGYSTPDNTVEHIEFYSNGSLPYGYTIESLQNLPNIAVSYTGDTIKAYYDSSKKTVFIYSEGEIEWFYSPNYDGNANLFINFKSLKDFTLPYNVQRIENGIFSGCDNLEVVKVAAGNPVFEDRNSNAIIEKSTNKLVAGCKTTVIPESVTSIHNYAFYNVSSLTNISIPNSVTAIGNYAFYGCASLTSITIPSSVTSIGIKTFSNTNKVSSIKVSAGNTIYEDRNSNAIIEKSTNTIVVGCKNSTIPSSVTVIGNYAFNGCSGLTNITIPSNITRIGYSAFFHSGLTTATFETTTGWVIYRTSNNAVLNSNPNLSNPSTNATMLKTSEIYMLRN